MCQYCNHHARPLPKPILPTNQNLKKYIVVGDNNIWYSEFETENENQLKEIIKDITANLNNYEGDTPEEIYVYEFVSKKTIKL